MSVDLFDVQCGFAGLEPGERGVLTADALLAELDRLSIQRALVRLAPERLDMDVPRSNLRLYEAADRQPRLVPCPTVFPDADGSPGCERGQVAEAIQRGARAAVVRPETDYWSLEPWACDSLFTALQERRLPVLCPESMVPLDALGRLAGRYPELPLIAVEVGYRGHRVLKPLLKTFPNVFLSIGNNFTAHKGVEYYVRDVGAKRLLFGTGLPYTEAMTSIAQLVYADLSEEEMALIGSGNLERLTEGVAL